MAIIAALFKLFRKNKEFYVAEQIVIINFDRIVVICITLIMSLCCELDCSNCVGPEESSFSLDIWYSS
jgi:hypothetical protein